jgi:glycoprotein 2-beta-D-xylosyltransferase
MFTSAFNLSSATHSPKKPRVAKVLFVRREDYLAHPRHTGKAEPHISNEEELLDALKTWASQRASDELGVSVVNGLFAHMPMEEQLQEVQESSIIVGAHGAGLAHLLFARPEKTAILELVTPSFKRPHFPAMSHRMGMEYHAIEMRSPEADCLEVTDHVDNILSGSLKRHACNPLESHLESGEGMDKVNLSDMELKRMLLQFTHVRFLCAISRNEVHILDHNELDVITN